MKKNIITTALSAAMVATTILTTGIYTYSIYKTPILISQ